MSQTKLETGTKSAVSTGTHTPLSLRDQLRTIKEDIDNKWVDFAILAEEAYVSEAYKTWGFADFKDYLQADLNMEYRTGMNRVHMGRTIKALGISREKIQEVGPSKFKDLANILDEETTNKELNALLNKAKKMSARELAQYVKDTRLERQGSEGASKKVKITLNFRDEQAEVFEAAVNMMMERLDLTPTDINRSIAIECICADWQMNMTQGEVTPALKKYAQEASVKEETGVGKVKHREHAHKGKKAAKKKTAKKTTKKGE